nr:hypothetical protein [uncultured Campylobacter sp.]
MSINFGSQKSLPLRNSNYAKSRSYWRRSARVAKIYKSQNLQKSCSEILAIIIRQRGLGGAPGVREE